MFSFVWLLPAIVHLGSDCQVKFWEAPHLITSLLYSGTCNDFLLFKISKSNHIGVLGFPVSGLNVLYRNGFPLVL